MISRLTKLAWPLLAFFLPLALYAKTLASTYIPIDSAEFALCMHFWGICHPPGFPLYVLAGKIFTGIFPFGSLIYKANLLSAIFGAGTILLVYLAQVELRVNRRLAMALSLLLAVSQVFWEFSTAADVFTFGAFLVALTFFLAFKKRKYLTFFVLGLSASHFYITAILAPVFLWYGWGKDIKFINFIIVIFASSSKLANTHLSAQSAHKFINFIILHILRFPSPIPQVLLFLEQK